MEGYKMLNVSLGEFFLQEFYYMHVKGGGGGGWGVGYKNLSGFI